MILLISIQVPLNRTNITDCYSSESYLNIKLNSYRLVLNLVPTNKTECHNFSQGVFVNLTLHATGYICNNISMLVNNFTYANTTELEYNFYKDSPNVLNISTVFCNSTLTQDEYLQSLPIMTFAFVQIYNHYQITTFEVMKQKQVKLQISGCFSSLVGVINQNQDIILTLVPQLTCRNLINNQTSNSNNYISEISILFNDQSFTLNSSDLDNFINSYDNMQNISITINSDSKTQTIMQASQVSSQLQLISMQNNVSVQVFYDINFSKDTTDFFGLNYYAQENYRLLVRYDSQNAEQNLKGVNFSSYVIKLNLISGQTAVSYQQSVNKSQYDIYNRIWEINCNQMIDFEKTQCMDIYDKIKENTTAEVLIQILFYDDSDQFLTSRQLSVIRAFNCFQNVRFTILNNEVGLVQYNNVTTESCNKLLQMKFENAGMVVSDTTYPGPLEDIMILVPDPDLNNLEFKCSTELCKKQLFPRARKSPTLLFTKSVINNKIIYLVGFTDRATLAQGNLTTYVSVGIGCALAVGALISTLYEMVMTMKKVKLIKKKKLAL